jgi:hypothetical protein
MRNRTEKNESRRKEEGDIYTKRARQTVTSNTLFLTVCAAFSKTANARSVCANSQKLGKGGSAFGICHFSKKVCIPAGKNRSKLIFSGVFEFVFSKKMTILLRANRRKQKRLSVFGDI